MRTIRREVGAAAAIAVVCYAATLAADNRAAEDQSASARAPASASADPYNLRSVVEDPARLALFQRFMDPTGLVVGGRVQPNWLPDGTSFWYSTGAPDDKTFWRVDGATGKQSPFHPEETIAPPPAASESPQTYAHPAWMLGSIDGLELLSPDKRWFTSVTDGNVMLRPVRGGSSVQVTSDGVPDFGWSLGPPQLTVVNGKTVGVHRRSPWSPDSRRLFGIKADRREVPTLSYIQFAKPQEEVVSIKTHRAGAPIDVSYPHVIDVESRRVRAFAVGDTKDQIFTLIGWLPDSSAVLFTRHSRDFKSVEILIGKASDGSVRPLFTERSDTFVALQHDIIFGGDNHATLLADGSGLIWRSSRSGWNHFYLYSLRSGYVRALTGGDYAVIDVIAVDQKAGWIYFTAHHDPQRPYDIHLCRVRLSGGAVQRLTPLDGENEIALSPSMRTFTVVNSRPDRPYRTDFFTTAGKHLSVVQQADITALDALGEVTPQEFVVSAADGTTPLWGVMYVPADLDPGKKYPIIDHLYAGPQHTMVTRTFSLGDDYQKRLDRALAQLGYIVISVDARGTPERSKAFQDVVYGNWGRNEIPDHVAAIRGLAKRHPFIDLDRVGVWGHSWGGYFSVRAMAQAPEVFKVGLATASGLNPYDMIIYEPYLNLPDRAKAAYDFANNNNWAAKITGKLMLVQGTGDPPRPGITMRFVRELINAGVEHEFVVLPDAGHSFAGRDADYFIHKLVAHFERNLKLLRSGSGAASQPRP